MNSEPRKSRAGDVLLSTFRTMVNGKLYRVDYRDFCGVRGFTVYDKAGKQIDDYNEYMSVVKEFGVNMSSTPVYLRDLNDEARIGFLKQLSATAAISEIEGDCEILVGYYLSRPMVVRS